MEEKIHNIEGITLAYEIPDGQKETARKAQVVKIRWEDSCTGLQYVFFRGDLIQEMLRELSKIEKSEVISGLTRDLLNNDTACIYKNM